MISESAEKRSEFRFPVVLPAEYFAPYDSGIVSYALDLSKSGIFISSDDPLSVGSRFGIHLTVPAEYESSKIFRTEGSVAWNKMRCSKSKTNGMGIRFIEPLPEKLLLNALADHVQKLMRETEKKGLFQERVEKLESELERVKRLAALGRFVEKILVGLSNPILTLTGKLTILMEKLNKQKTMLKGHEDTHKEDLKEMAAEFGKWCTTIDQILNEYKTISELARIVGDDREILEGKLQRYQW